VVCASKDGVVCASKDVVVCASKDASKDEYVIPYQGYVKPFLVRPFLVVVIVARSTTRFRRIEPRRLVVAAWACRIPHARFACTLYTDVRDRAKKRAACPCMAQLPHLHLIESQHIPRN
jgi:hypothetical protein